MEEMSENARFFSLYYLNNFNSYTEGLVTVFNIMVSNDCHEIAKVFLYADRLSHRFIVYPSFILVVLVAVCIMLNIITAFFVESKQYPHVFHGRFFMKGIELTHVYRCPVVQMAR
jgi:hypothetical protein